MLDSEPTTPIQISPRDRELIANLLSVEPDIVEKCRLAIVKGKMLLVKLSAEDLELLLGAIAADANHSKSKKLVKELDDLFGRLEDMLASEFPEG